MFLSKGQYCSLDELWKSEALVTVKQEVERKGKRVAFTGLGGQARWMSLARDNLTHGFLIVPADIHIFGYDYI